jgi:Na+/H+ antiporter NhaD/arsenite permease-like protein
MFTHFGWHAVTGIVISNVVYFLAFRRELLALQPADRSGGRAEEPVPAWVTGVHLLFLGFTVWAAHTPVLFIGGFLFYLAFAQATAHHQSKVELRGPMLVGFFLAGLVIHGGLQAWWIQPVLGSLGEVPLFAGATILTAFNDNALITYLATLVPGFSEELKYAVVAGAVTGGGLTVIANAPNPAGQSILQRHFPEGISPLGLLLGALPPTLVVVFSFMVL